jgi:hypothetical protein
MTTGNYTDDKRLTDAYGRKYGIYYHREWSGGDDPPNHPDPGTVRSLARRGEHSYVADITSALDVQYTAYVGYNKVTQACYYPSYQTTSDKWGSFGYPDRTWGANDDIALYGKLRNKVAGSSFNLGIFLGTGHEALRTIEDGAKRIASAMLHFRSGHWVKAANALVSGTPRAFLKDHKGYLRRRHASVREWTEDTASSRWLELQYGWLPLLSDVHDGAQFLANRMSQPRRMVHRARYWRNTGVTGYSGFVPETDISRTYGQIIAIIEEENSVALSGLTDPASVLWELTPWSFVADWFIPVQNYLQARALSGSLTGTFVVTKMQKRIVKGLRFQGDPDLIAHCMPDGVPGFYYKHVHVDREPFLSLPDVPLPEIKPLGQVPSWRRAANAVSLLLQQVSIGRLKGVF